MNRRGTAGLGSSDLQRSENSLRSPSGGPAAGKVGAFLDLTLQNASQSLLDLRRVMEALPVRPPSQESQEWLQPARPVVLLEALWETMAVLERTKSSFKSKELGRLRKKLQELVSA